MGLLLHRGWGCAGHAVVHVDGMFRREETETLPLLNMWKTKQQ